MPDQRASHLRPVSMKGKKNTGGTSKVMSTMLSTVHEARKPAGNATPGSRRVEANDDTGSGGWQSVFVLAIIAFGVIMLMVRVKRTRYSGGCTLFPNDVA
jgi:hypothetical protein